MKLKFIKEGEYIIGKKDIEKILEYSYRVQDARVQDADFNSAAFEASGFAGYVQGVFKRITDWDIK